MTKSEIWAKIESLAKENTKFPNGDRVYMKKSNAGGTPAAAFRTHFSNFSKIRTFTLKHNSQGEAFEYAETFLEKHNLC